jgi:hypothetical protein
MHSTRTATFSERFGLIACLSLTLLIAACSAPNRYQSVLTGSDWVSILGIGEGRNAKTLDFCDLRSLNGELVRIQAVYSGALEYWSLGVENQCVGIYRIDLDTYRLSSSFPDHAVWDQFERLAEEDNPMEAVVDVVGIFRTGRRSGYGHLGSYESQIDARALHIVEIRRAEWAGHGVEVLPDSSDDDR